MKRKITFLISAAVMLLTMMATTGTAFADNASYVFNTDAGIAALGITKPDTGAGTSLSTTTPYVVGQISMTATHGSTDTRVWNSSGTLDLRIYKSGGSLTFAAASGYKITGITVAGSAINNFSVNVGTYSAGSWSNSTTGATSVTFTATNTGKINTITVTYESTGGPTQLDAPTNLTVTPGNEQLAFSWDAVTNASSYTLSYTTDSEWETQTDVENIATNSKTVTGLTNGTTYYAKVKAVGDGVSYSTSNYSSVTSAAPTAATYYDITITTPLTGGSVSASAATATSGTTVTLTATPSAGYTFSNIASNWSVVDEGDNPVTVTPGASNTATFTMPASDVTVSAIFTAMPVYTVTCTTPTNGTLSASPTSGYNGVQITITATPNSGYELATLTATDSEGEITITDNKFNIRNSNVTVAATFTAAVVYDWVPAAIGDLTGSDVFVIVGNNGSNYAMTNNNGTSSAPAATSVTISEGKITSAVADTIKWNISGNADDGYTFYPNGTTETWLYCTNTNNGVRVGTNANKTFKLNSGYLKHDATARYVGIYNSSDWRCYTSNTGNIADQTFAFYKRVVQAAVATPTFSVAAGTYNANQSVTITCATDGATIYYTTDGSTPTSSSTAYSSAVSITQTTTLKAIAIKGGDESSVASATYTLKCATPTFSPVGGAYIGTQSVTITCATDGASIYYTTDGTTPTSSSTAYSSAISISETKTLKAIAIKSNWSDSDVQSATYTITVPLTTMDEILAKAIAVGSTETSVYVTFDSWVISGVSGSTAYLTDGTKGCMIYKSGHGFYVGDILSGTAQCKIMLYNNAPELTNLTSETSGLTVNTGGTITPTETTIAELGAINTGSAFTIKDLTYTSSTVMLSDGTNNIKPKTNLYDFSSYVTNGKKYHVTGIFVIYNSEKQIYPRSAADIVLAADMSATDLSGLTTFTYVVGGGPSTAQHIDLLGEDFAGDLTVTASGDYEVSTDNTTYSTSVVVAQDKGEIAEDLYVRLKSGLATGTYNGTLTFTATNLTTIVKNLTGTVTVTPTYEIMIDSPIAHGTVTSSASVAEAGTTITLTATSDECYQFVEWVTDPDDLTWTSANQFTMPAEDVLVSATFSKITYTVQYSVNGNVEDDLEADVDCGDAAPLWDNDDLASAGIDLPSGFSLLGWSSTDGGIEPLASFTVEDDATLYAILMSSGSSAGYELVTSASQITAGKYLFAAFRSAELPSPVKYYIATGSITSGDLVVTSTSYAPTTNVFATIPTGGVEFELTGNNSDGFVISYNSNSLGYTSYSNRTLAWGDYSAYLWKFHDKDGGLSTGAIYMDCDYNDEDYTVSENSTGEGAIRGYASSTAYRGFYLFKKNASFNTITEYTSTQTLSTNIPENTCIVVGNNAVVTFTGTNNGSSANIVIEDGAQLIHTSPVEATIQKNVTAASSWKSKGVDGWHFIASPVDGLSTSVVASDHYDLYKYDEETAYWIYDHGASAAHPFSTLERGKGYLYASKDPTTLDFAGSMEATNATIQKDLSWSCSTYPELKGFNLMGNPFTRNLTTGDMKIDATSVTSYYGINAATNDIITYNIADNPIKPGQGFMVQATAASQKLIFNPTSKDNDDIYEGYISIKAGNDNSMDKAFVQIGNGNTLRKMTLSDNTMVYVMNDDEDYAAARVDELAGSMPVHFKTIEAGTQTITIEARDIEAYSMKLIDNFTNEVIDLLLEPTYTFEAEVGDDEARFLLVFDFNNYANVEEGFENSHFAYQFGDELILNGNGTLQVFDVMGRFVMSRTINGSERISTSALNSGVYVLRLDNKIQKIVIR